MTYEEALTYIHSVVWRGSRLGLDRTYELMEKLGNPQKDLKFIHIAGTNGKGSASAMMASVLQEAGYKVGLYTSPFIYRFNERMQVNGEMIADEELAELTEMIQPFADSMEDSPTEFELITALAMVYFKRHECDIVVLEVGLGGALDSTNVIPVPELAVIMAIGLDHTAELGGTISEITEAKAGIIKEGGDVVAYGRDPEAEAVLARVCEERHASLYYPEYERLNPVLSDLEGQFFDYNGFQNLRISMPGLYQMYNAAVVIRAMQILNSKEKWYISDEAIRDGLAKTRWNGRFEILHRNPTVIIDGSHNPHGINATVESLKNYFEDTKLIFLIGVMADKDVEHIMDAVLPMAKEFVTVTPDNPRAMKADVLAEKLNQMGAPGVTAASSVEEGCRIALEKAGRTGVVCSIGSLYMVGDVTREMKKLLR
ncbi:MAG: bifunctional folylpolyglutamate synthase/dihydrofolate synthase [Clostridiales bacterium]|nr:bifunctional folylpolyglutamate synthase/dihydrofolate synthase [Clostridiales bacterium]